MKIELPFSSNMLVARRHHVRFHGLGVNIMVHARFISADFLNLVPNKW